MGELFPTSVYALCFATSGACAWLLLRSYLRTRSRLLMWSALCFLFLALNNLLVIVDLVLIEDIDFQIPRLMSSAIAVCVLLYGFIWDLDDE